MVKFFRYLWMVLPMALQSQSIPHQFLPAQTHPAINGSNDPHLAYRDVSQPERGTLLLFFPGTNAQGLDYERFLETVAALGYHVLALDYENDISINLQACTSSDSTCHRRVRGEIWTGQDLHPMVDVGLSNSILFRCSQALLYLAQQYPAENWSQYLMADSSIHWQKVATAGHSQGAGHAAFGGFLFPVQRVIMISWTDWLYPGRTADWITMPRPSPDSVYFGFIHTGDASIYHGIPTTWAQMGMDAFGPIVLVDNLSKPYQHSHQLISSAPIDSLPTQVNFHNTTCVDHMLVLDGLGNPVYLPVWEYLLGEQPGMGQSASATKEAPKAWPNPFQDFVKLPPGARHSRLIGVSGALFSEEAQPNIIDTKPLAPGMYLLHWQDDLGNRYCQKMLKTQTP